MSKAIEKIKIEFPKNAKSADVEEIAGELNQLDQVEQAKTRQTRGLDFATISMVIEVAGGVIGVASQAAPLLKKIFGSVKEKKIHGARITFPDGRVIEVDDASMEDIERLIQATK
ncbi:MAG: hypothetical protein WBP93_12000 [Pyrinomonadaceae bacterium]